MTFKELKNKIKEEQKALAQQIRNGKVGRKPGNRNEDNLGDFKDLVWNRYHYRHTHVAYCEFFNNTPYEKIESPRSENDPSLNTINNLKEAWQGQISEAIRDCA